MARFSFRGFVYVLIVMLGLLSAAPNILPQSIKQQLPTWYTTSTLSLGLDLQGGSHLLLAADTNALFEKQLNSFSSDATYLANCAVKTCAIQKRLIHSLIKIVVLEVWFLPCVVQMM